MKNYFDRYITFSFEKLSTKQFHIVVLSPLKIHQYRQVILISVRDKYYREVWNHPD